MASNYFLICYNGHEDVANEKNVNATVELLERMKVKYSVKVM